MCEESAAHLENLRAHNDELSDALAAANEATKSADAARAAVDAECETLRRANALAAGTYRAFLIVCFLIVPTNQVTTTRAEERLQEALARAQSAEATANSATGARDEARTRADLGALKLVFHFVFD